jgi:hypothetical protein
MITHGAFCVGLDRPDRVRFTVVVWRGRRMRELVIGPYALVDIVGRRGDSGTAYLDPRIRRVTRGRPGD